ncbi:DUF4304 domain-containing protein [Breznakiellaceae bacterium SP9]
MKPKEIFINGCSEIIKAFAGYGFKPLKKGQLLKKISADNDIYSEIYFQTSDRNNSAYVSVFPHLSIYSNELKKWKIEPMKNETSDGLIYRNSIGYISPYNTFKEWNLAGATFNQSIQEIIRDINLYIIPIIDIFDNKTNAIEYLKTNGTQFNKWTKKSLDPMDFMICFGGKETAEIFLKDYIKSDKFGNRVKGFYKELETKENIDVNYIEFVGANKIKIAFINGIKI